jgi:predicted TIM-barrel fold metal-dependent hydrolase
VRYSHPRNYKPILKAFPDLRLCLAHFGGSNHWDKHLKSRTPREGDRRAWGRWIADLIRSGDYPNLYTDISCTIFAGKPKGLYFDYFDYLKVLLEDPNLRTHVLFGSDYYMIERSPLSEKEVSISLRSRLGSDLYFQIAHHNPMEYLGIQDA